MVTDLITLMRGAYIFAEAHSHDTSTRNGALLVSQEGGTLCGGANRFPPGLDSDKLVTDREVKYSYIEHAERAVIYAAARAGIRTLGLIMICPWACCPDCARAIVLAGLSEVVVHKQALDQTPERWRASVERGAEIQEFLQ